MKTKGKTKPRKPPLSALYDANQLYNLRVVAFKLMGMGHTDEEIIAQMIAAGTNPLAVERIVGQARGAYNECVLTSGGEPVVVAEIEGAR